MRDKVSKEITDLFEQENKRFLKRFTELKEANPQKPCARAALYGSWQGSEDKSNSAVKFAPFKPLPKINTDKEMMKEMYESPIELITDNVLTQIRKNQEDYVYEVVQNMGVNVNKEELLKALAYDRQQYCKGFEDGIREFVKIIIEKYCCDGSVTISNLVDHAKEFCKKRGMGNG